MTSRPDLIDLALHARGECAPRHCPFCRIGLPQIEAAARVRQSAGGARPRVKPMAGAPSQSLDAGSLGTSRRAPAPAPAQVGSATET